MSELLHGMAISSAILLCVVVLIVIVSMAAVKRGEAAMHGEAHGPLLEPAVAVAGAAPKPDKPAVIVKTEDPSVIEIVLFGLALFVLTVLCLIGVSVLSHLG